MNREQAEKLLAVLVFDDLDEASKAELMAYLQTDDELRERWADMRMAAKLARDAVNDGPDPVLSKHRLKELERLARAGKPRTHVVLRRCLTAAAAVLVLGTVLAGMLIPSLSKVREQAGGALAPAEVKEPSADHYMGYGGDSQADAKGYESDEVRRRLAQMSSSRSGRGGMMGGMDGMGGMGGYGMGGGGIRNGSTTSSGDGDIRVAGGMSFSGRLPESDEASVARAQEPLSSLGLPTRRPALPDAEWSDKSETSALYDLQAKAGVRDRARGARGGSLPQPTQTAPPVSNGGVAQNGAAPPTVVMADGGIGSAGEVFRNEATPGSGVPRVARGGRGVSSSDFEALRRLSQRKAAQAQREGVTSSADRVTAYWRQPTSEAEGEPVARSVTTRSTDTLEDDRLPQMRTEGETLGGAVAYGWSGTVTPTRPSGQVVSAGPTGGPQDTEASERVLDLGSESGGSWSYRLQDGREQASISGYWVTARKATSDTAQKDKAASLEGEEPSGAKVPATASGIVADDESVVDGDVSGPAEQNRRVPVMGDLPVVGGLFRNEKGLEEQSQHQVSVSKPRSARSITDGPNNEKLDQMSVLELQTEAESLHKKLEDVSDLPSESRFKVVPVNPWVMTERDAQSTFALDVDTASYALCRRYIRSGFLPPIGAVRMEEFINAFDYAYPQREAPTFAVYADGAPSPFAPEGQDLTLLKIAVKARTVGRDQRRAAHLVFVIDASASMGQPDRLGAVQSTLDRLVDRLSDGDRVSLVTCANEARLHLEAVSARQRDTIRRTIDAIQPAGPTNLLAGLKLGYATARRAFVAGQINQVVLCSDGVANVGQVEADAVLEEVAQDRKQAITLTCVGVGYGAYNDAFLESLADHGDGRYVFLDSGPEAQEAFVGQLTDTLQTVAKDARIQVQFNPARVRRYRLIGYENRDIEDQRFRDDTIDAGEVGSGQCSTALYELELTARRDAGDTHIGTVFVRYRDMDTDRIEEIARPLAGSAVRRRSVEEDPRFFLAAGAARFAEWLRQSEHARYTALADVQHLLDQVSAALPLDRDIQGLAALAHQAESLPRAP